MGVNKFQLRKDIFDYFKSNLTNVDVAPEHPLGTSSTNPKIVISLIRDQAAGAIVNPLETNPEIQITCYTNKELELTKPNGLMYQVESLMSNFNPGYNFHKIKDIYVGYVPDVLLYCNYLIYRFYSQG